MLEHRIEAELGCVRDSRFRLPNTGWVCNDETRFHLNGVYFESDGSKSRMVSTTAIA